MALAQDYTNTQYSTSPEALDAFAPHIAEVTEALRREAAGIGRVAVRGERALTIGTQPTRSVVELLAA